MPAPDATGSPRQFVRGALLMVATVFCFAVLDTLAKWLTRDYHVVQIVWARYLFHVLILFALVPRFGLLRPFRSRRPGIQMLRSALLVLATLCFFNALRFLPLAEAATIGYAMPLILTALAPFLLKERVGPRRWTAVAIGFIGVVVVIRPGAEVVQWAAFLALGTATFNALYQIATRMLSQIDSTETTLAYTGVVGAFGLSLIVPFFWTTPDLFGWLLMAGTGVCGGLGHYLLIVAYSRTQASALAPLTYSQIVWITLFGYVVFGDFPDMWTIAGATIIIASGIYVFYRESVLRRAGRL